MEKERRIRTVLYGDQAMATAELDLLHTPSLQRLYDLHQLGFTDKVFVDASHTRFAHVIGVMHQASKILGAIASNLQKQHRLGMEYERWKKLATSAPTRGDFVKEVQTREPALRLMALLHDLTHAPFGHTLEDEIELTGEKHDEPARQAKAFLRLTCEWIIWQWRETRPRNGVSTPEMDAEFDWFEREGAFLDDLATRKSLIACVAQAGAQLCGSSEPNLLRSNKALPPGECPTYLRHLAFAFRALFHLEAAHKAKLTTQTSPQPVYAVDKLLADILSHPSVNASLREEDKFQPCRDAYLLDVIGNTICADLLDYAQRDAQTAGVKITYDSDRIVENFTLVVGKQPGTKRGHPFHGRSVRSAVSLFTHKFRPDAVGELMALLSARYFVYERILYHPTKCVAGAALGASLQWMGWREMPPHLRLYGDATFLQEIREAALVVTSLLKEEKSDEPYSQAIATRLIDKLGAVQIGTLVSAKHLLTDLIPRSVPIRELCKRMQPLAESDQEVSLLQEIMDMCPVKPGGELKDEVVDWKQWTKQLKGKQPAQQKRILELGETLVPSSSMLATRIDAGLRMFSALMSRRYPQRVFTLIGPKHLVDNLEHEAEEIAETFRDAVNRRVAERAIEVELSLPNGSVVIHCPGAKGPVKLADVLLTSGEHKTPVCTLRHVGKLKGLKEGMLVAHEQVVVAQENMYRSTWRLSVAILRPYDALHSAEAQKMFPVIGKVLYRMVKGEYAEDSSGFENDLTMVKELEASLSKPEVIVPRPEPPETMDGLVSWNGKHYNQRMAQRVIEAVAQDPRFNAPLTSIDSFAATSKTPEEEAQAIYDQIKDLLSRTLDKRSLPGF